MSQEPVSGALMPVQDDDARFTDASRRRALRLLSAGAAAALFGAPLRLRADPLAQQVRRALAPLPHAATDTVTDDGVHAAETILAIGGTAFSVGLSVATATGPLGIGVAIIGGVLSLVGTLISIFWPGSQPDLWSQIRDKVQALIDSAISDAEYAALQATITGLRNNLTDYLALAQQHMQLRSAQSLSQLRQKYIAVDTYCIGVRPLFLPHGSEERFLPLFVQFANLHHILLQDMVLNGKAWGVEPGILANDVAKLSQTVALNGAAFDMYWQGIEGKFRYRMNLDGHNIGATRYTSTYGNHTYVEDHLYDAIRDAHNTYSQLLAVTRDFRELWPYMGGLREGPAALKRQLWFGPFGRPDARDVNDYDYIKSHGGSLWGPDWRPTSGCGSVRMPEGNGVQQGTAVSSLNVTYLGSGTRPDWHFPVAITPVRDSAAPAGPIVGIRVDSAYYKSMGHRLPAAGFLVARVYATRKDGSQVHYGDWPGTPSGGDGRELQAYYGEDVAVPKHHVLSDLRVTTMVRSLYDNVDSGRRSAGSIMFAFQLEDPYLTPAPDVLGLIAASNPGVSAKHLVELVRASRMASGKPLSGEEATRLHAQMQGELDSAPLKAKRAAFQDMLAERLARMQAAQPATN